jgi:hypothetical protein
MYNSKNGKKEGLMVNRLVSNDFGCLRFSPGSNEIIWKVEAKTISIKGSLISLKILI